MRRILWFGLVSLLAVVLLGAGFLVGMATAQPAKQSAVTAQSSGQSVAGAQSGVATAHTLPATRAAPTPLAPSGASSGGYNTWGQGPMMGTWENNQGMNGNCCGYGNGGRGMHDDWDSNMPGWGMGMHWGYTNTTAVPITIPPATTADTSYRAEVQPIFDARCVACHGGTQGLYLTDYESVMRGGTHGLVIVPGDPASSRLIWYISSGYMPYGGPTLTQDQIQTLVNWVAAGAPNN